MSVLLYRFRKYKRIEKIIRQIVDKAKNPATIKAIIAAVRHRVKSARVFKKLSWEQSEATVINVSVSGDIDVVDCAFDVVVDGDSDLVVVVSGDLEAVVASGDLEVVVASGDLEVVVAAGGNDPDVVVAVAGGDDPDAAVVVAGGGNDPDVVVAVAGGDDPDAVVVVAAGGNDPDVVVVVDGDTEVVVVSVVVVVGSTKKKKGHFSYIINQLVPGGVSVNWNVANSKPLLNVENVTLNCSPLVTMHLTYINDMAWQYSKVVSPEGHCTYIFS